MKPRKTEPKLDAPPNFHHLQAVFQNIQDQFKLQCFSTCSYPSQSKIETSFVLLEVPERAKLLTTLTFVETKTEIKVQTITRLCWTDLMPITLPHSNLIKLMSRYFIKLNGSFRYGFFVVDTATGNISFRVNTNTHFVNYCNNPLPLKIITRINITTAYFALKFHIYKILCMINILTHKEMSALPQLIEKNPNSLPHRKLNPDFFTHLDGIRASLLSCRTNPTVWKLEQKGLLTYPISPESASYKSTIITPIEILRVDDRKQSITSGGFGELSLIRITYRIKNEERSIQRQVIMKEEKATARNSSNRNNIQIDDPQFDGQRINNESLVLKHFQYRNSASMFVAKFFDAADFNKISHGINEKAILMEYYPHKSLEHFKIKNDNMSLNTKIWFFVQIANGIRYLCQEGVFHLDIKASNILVQKNYTLKLIDFGESYLSTPHPRLGLTQLNYKNHFKPGRTLPYAAPELVQKPFKPDNLNERTDVFSFGMMMGEMLFDNFLIDFKKSNLANVVQKYQTLTYKSKLTNLSAHIFGPKKLIKYLRIIALLCISPNPKERPTQEWLVVMLKEALQYLEKAY